MNRVVAVWIDHSEARIATLFNDDRVVVDTVSSGVDQPRRARAPRVTPVPGHPGGIPGLTPDRRRDDCLDRFYHDVAEFVRGADRLLILGPAEARVGFAVYLEDHALASREGGPGAELLVQAADSLSEAELVSRVFQFSPSYAGWYG